jgi:SAM-dependent methyltransferase
MKNELKEMFTEHWNYLAVSAACKLKLFDKIFEGQNDINKLEKENNWRLKQLSGILTFLISKRYLLKNEDASLEITEKGNLLREGNPDGLYYACLNWSGEHLNAWQHLDYSIKTGKSSFDYIYHQPYFDYLDNHPEKLHYYHKAMYEYARDDYQELPVLINFGVHKSVMDVGGGYGAAIRLIKQNNPNTKCYLFDLKSVIENVAAQNIETIGGSFFKKIPKVAEAIILSRILHDWSDERSSVILRNCFEALPKNGNLYIVENCTDRFSAGMELLSLNMTVMCKSFERSRKEYVELCEKAGFEFHTDKQLNKLQTVLIFKKR